VRQVLLDKQATQLATQEYGVQVLLFRKKNGEQV
jgi:hypothetical protein